MPRKSTQKKRTTSGRNINNLGLSEHHENVFWSHVATPDENECCMWTGSTRSGRDARRYGRIYIGRSAAHSQIIKPAQDVSFYLREGRWPRKNKIVYRSCMNSLCMSWDHIDEGTRSDVQDILWATGTLPPHPASLTSTYKCGHPKNGDNDYWYRSYESRRRRCRICDLRKSKERKRRKAALRREHSQLTKN